MNLSPDRFYKSSAVFFLHDQTFQLPVYGYETKKEVYELLVYGSAKYVRIGVGTWSNTIDKWHQIHYEVERYFDL